jgi:tRNA1Val (adenine37-N6)-methyltransferase
LVPSGLLALMLAQRTDENVIIDAVELDVDAAQQAQENIAQSPWMHRVSVHTEDAQQWIPRQTVRFDLIISNPPYYEQECATAAQAHTTSLDHQRCLRWRTALRKTVFLCGATGADW